MQLCAHCVCVCVCIQWDAKKPVLNISQEKKKIVYSLAFRMHIKQNASSVLRCAVQQSTRPLTVCYDVLTTQKIHWGWHSQFLRFHCIAFGPANWIHNRFGQERKKRSLCILDFLRVECVHCAATDILFSFSFGWRSNALIILNSADGGSGSLMHTFHRFPRFLQALYCFVSLLFVCVKFDDEE